MINQFDWAAKWAIYSPQKIAFKEYETERTLTYEELNRLGNRLANHLTNQYHIKRGDRIAVLAENCLEYVVLFVAAQKTGCILVPINYRLTSTEISYLLKNAEPKGVFFDVRFKEKVREEEHNDFMLFTSSIEELKGFLDKTKRQKEDDFIKSIDLHDDDPILILFTSGTTGFPKGALYTHKMLFWNSVNTALSLILNTESRTVNCMPLFHTGGWNVLMTPFFHHGAYTCLVKSFDAKVILKLLQKESPTIFMGVPTMLKMISDLSDFDSADLSSLFYILVGGEPMPIPLIEKWDKKGIAIRQGFGMTEVGPNLTSLYQGDAIRKKGSIGRPNFYVQTKIVNDKKEVCKSNEHGELLLKGPVLMPGYWDNETATNKAFSDGWFHTGDRVYQDEEGYLYIVDRIKNMYISGGENVYPAEVERILINHLGVSHAVVVGIKDEKWGESGRAFIVKKADVTASEIIKYCESKLAKFKVPKSVVFLDELPKNDTGKIDRKVLKERI